MAGQREVVRVVRSAVLPGDDVFDVVCQRAVLLPEQAIFAAIVRAAADQFPRCRSDHECALEVSLRWAFNFRMAMKSAALISASYSARLARRR